MELQSADEDMEWYPTTEAMVDTVARHYRQIVAEDHHYALDYRIVWKGHIAIEDPTRDTWRCDYVNGLARHAHERIGGIFVVTKNLGFNVDPQSSQLRRWTNGGQQGFYMQESDGSRALFAEIRAYKNDNTHFKLNQNFVRALNIEAARLLGWIKSPQEASVQMGITIEQATERFGTNIQLLKAPLLLG
jgi:hypothetical protein